MAIVAAAALLQVILVPQAFDPLPYDVAVLVAMYSVVKYGKHMRDVYLAGAVVGIGIVIQVVRHPQQPWLPMTLWYVGVCGGERRAAERAELAERGSGSAAIAA